RVVWEHVMSTIGADGEAVRAPVEVTSELRAAGSDVLREAGWNGRRRVMMVHAGAGGRDKRWPVEGFAEVVAQVARHHDLVVALHEGPADRDAVAALAERIDALVLKQPTLPHLAGAVVIAGGVGVAVVEWLGFPKGSVWIVVALTVVLVVVIRGLTRRRS